MNPQELILDDLRRHPGSTRIQISERCGLVFNTVKYTTYRLMQDQVIGKSKEGHNDYRYFVIADAVKKKPIPDYQKTAIRAAVRLEQFKQDIIPIIDAMPGRSSFFYANYIGHRLQQTIHKLKCLEGLGLIVYKKHNSTPNGKPILLWFISGKVPECLEDIQAYDERVIEKERKKLAASMIVPVNPINAEDEKWFIEIRKSREQRRLERLRAQDVQATIPSYADFFRQQAGRN